MYKGVVDVCVCVCVCVYPKVRNRSFVAVAVNVNVNQGLTDGIFVVKLPLDSIENCSVLLEFELERRWES